MSTFKSGQHVSKNELLEEDFVWLKKHIEQMSPKHHVRIAQVIRDNDEILSENKSGIYVKLNGLKTSTILKMRDVIFEIHSGGTVPIATIQHSNL